MTATLQRRLCAVERHAWKDGGAFAQLSDVDLLAALAWVNGMLAAHGGGAAAETLLTPEDTVEVGALRAKITAALRQRQSAAPCRGAASSGSSRHWVL